MTIWKDWGEFLFNYYFTFLRVFILKYLSFNFLSSSNMHSITLSQKQPTEFFTKCTNQWGGSLSGPGRPNPFTTKLLLLIAPPTFHGRLSPNNENANFFYHASLHFFDYGTSQNSNRGQVVALPPITPMLIHFFSMFDWTLMIQAD